MRTHGLIKKIANSYRYYLTDLGKRLLIAGSKLIENIIIPELMPGKV